MVETILVTGATGTVGSEVVKQLSQRKENIHIRAAIHSQNKADTLKQIIDNKGDPNIQPVWFYYDKNEEKLFIMTGKKTSKSQNVRERHTFYSL